VEVLRLEGRWRLKKWRKLDKLGGGYLNNRCNLRILKIEIDGAESKWVV